jgi:hypothetical protein
MLVDIANISGFTGVYWLYWGLLVILGFTGVVTLRLSENHFLVKFAVAAILVWVSVYTRETAEVSVVGNLVFGASQALYARDACFACVAARLQFSDGAGDADDS